ncbi:MAG TPA: hypothetical protein VIX84_17155 [Acidimicrobiales bacterium]
MGYRPDFAGMDDYRGTVVHPQQWPESLDFGGKRVVVIGSGATAVTLVPAHAKAIDLVSRLPGTLYQTAFARGARRIRH